MSDVQVILPCGGPYDRRRERNARIVRDFYSDSFPDWYLHPAAVHTGEFMFWKARAVNQTVQFHDGAEIVVLNDADTLVEPAQIRKAVERARVEPRAIIAFTLYCRLDQAATERSDSWRELLEAPPEHVLLRPPSHGCLAMRRDLFLALGGYDEDFQGWGYEDVDFNRRHQARLGELGRVPGEATHLWHGDRRADDSPVDVPAEVVARNRSLLR